MVIRSTHLQLLCVGFAPTSPSSRLTIGCNPFQSQLIHSGRLIWDSNPNADQLGYYRFSRPMPYQLGLIKHTQREMLTSLLHEVL